MVLLGIVVAALGVLVYLSATRSPIVQRANEPTLEEETSLESIFETTTGQQETQVETAQENNNNEIAEDDEPEEGVVSVITLQETKTPNEETQNNRNTANLSSDEELYTVRMRSSWSERLHQRWHTEGSHLSPMVAWAHGVKDTLFASGKIASEGMEIMAESGATATLTEEIEAYGAAGSILSYNVGDVFFTPGEEEIQIKVSKNAPYITVVSMIAPSPDWFITARNIQLYENGRWLEQVSIPAVLYDAGTDSGMEFTSPDKDTQPKQPIHKIRNAPFLPIATFEFIKN